MRVSGWALTDEPEDVVVDSQSGRMPGLQALFPGGGEADGDGRSRPIGDFLIIGISIFLPLPLKIKKLCI